MTPEAETNLVAKLASIETSIQNLERDLLGNGQPGRVTKLETRVDDVEKKVWKTAGAMGAVVVLLEKALAGVHIAGLLK